MGHREILKTSWVYSLKKEELVTYLLQCGQDPTGTVEEMRKRLAKFITTEHDEDVTHQLLEWQKQHDQSSSGSPSVSLSVPCEKNEVLKSSILSASSPDIASKTMPEAQSEKPPTPSTREDRIATVELIRKWGLKYDGGKDVLKFTDRLEELATVYEINLSAVVPVMFELLKDRALIWFRNNRKPWEHWSHFKKDLLEFFLPLRYFEKLDIEIRSRTQRPRENFKDYLLALQDLMYHSSMSEEEKLEIIFRNSSPDYQWYIKRRDFKTLDELLFLAAELESIPTPKQPGRNEHHRMLHNLQSTTTNSIGANKQQTYLAWEEEKIKAPQKQRNHYNLRRRNWAPKIGDQVLVRQHPLSKTGENSTAKRVPKFKGPYIVTEFVPSVIVNVRAIETNERHTVPVSKLKPYNANNSSFSLISSRFKSTGGRHVENMETNLKKFERTRGKFQRNIQRERENKTRKIFSEDDEVSSSSKNRPSNRRRNNHQITSAQPMSKSNSEKTRKTISSLAVTNDTHQQLEGIASLEPCSSPLQHDYLHPPIPVTPGRNWMNPQIFLQSRTSPNLQQPMPVFVEPNNTSPIPSPPPIFIQNRSLVPSPPRIPKISALDHPGLEQLPEEIRKEINEVREYQKGTRVRLKREFWGHTYRITIQRGGEVTVTLI